MDASAAEESSSTEPSASADEASAEASPTEESFEPVMDFQDVTITHDHDQFPVSVDAELPVVSGVEQKHAEAFEEAFRDSVDELLHDVSEWAVEGEEYCPEDGDRCYPTAEFSVKEAEIFGDYATITYWLVGSPNYWYARASITPASVTMNMRTGEIPELSDFGSLNTSDVTNYILDHGECTEDYREKDENTRKPVAFSPTAKGLYLSWGTSTFSYSACGPAFVTLPWDSLDLDSQGGAGSQNESAVEDEPATSASHGSCAGNPQLPEGIDPRVCGDAPTNARAVTPGEYGTAVLTTPSENIWCTFSAGNEYNRPETDCIMWDPFTRFSVNEVDPARVPDYNDGPGGELPMTLNYGEAATYGQFACVSQEIGLSCWNTETKHGMFLSRSTTAKW